MSIEKLARRRTSGWGILDLAEAGGYLAKEMPSLAASLARHGLIAARDSNAAPYEDLRKLFENALPRDAALYNEFHALIVHAEKRFCRARNPRCSECALHRLIPQHKQVEHNGQHGQCDQERIANIG